jgi:type III restriction enzyme
MTTQVTDDFFARPILNSPYEYPARHWELDPSGQPTQKVIEMRRRAEFVIPIPKPRKRRAAQTELALDEGHGLSTDKQRYAQTSLINDLRAQVE